MSAQSSENPYKTPESSSTVTVLPAAKTKKNNPLIASAVLDMKAAWVTGIVLTVVMVGFGIFLGDQSVLGIVMAAVFGLMYLLPAVGVYFKNRAAAIILLVVYLVNILLPVAMGNIPGLLWIGIAIFAGYCLVRGIKGAFAYHRLNISSTLFDTLDQMHMVADFVCCSSALSDEHLREINCFSPAMLIKLVDGAPELMVADTSAATTNPKIVDVLNACKIQSRVYTFDFSQPTVNMYNHFALMMRQTTKLRWVHSEDGRVAAYLSAVYAEKNMGWSTSQANQLIHSFGDVPPAWQTWLSEVRK